MLSNSISPVPTATPSASDANPVAAKMDRGNLKVDHIFVPNRFSETYVMFDGEKKPMMYADVNWKALMKKGCANMAKCKHPIDGLRVPVLEGSVENTKGDMNPTGQAVATLVFEWPCCATPVCCYLPTLKAQVVSGDSDAPIANFVSEGGPGFFPLGAAMTRLLW
jgi:hypothetical protein